MCTCYPLIDIRKMARNTNFFDLLIKIFLFLNVPKSTSFQNILYFVHFHLSTFSTAELHNSNADIQSHALFFVVIYRYTWAEVLQHFRIATFWPNPQHAIYPFPVWHSVQVLYNKTRNNNGFHWLFSQKRTQNNSKNTTN